MATRISILSGGTRRVAILLLATLGASHLAWPALKESACAPGQLRQTLAPPYSPSEFLEALRGVAKTAPKSVAEEFFLVGGSKNLEFHITAQMIADSYDHPVYLEGSGRARIPALYRGDLYPMGYFFHNGFDQFPFYQERGLDPSRYPEWKDLVRSQPWFEWNPTSRTFVFKKAGAQAKILESLTGKTTVLYRGTSEFEGRLFRYIARLGDSPMTQSQRRKLAALMDEAVKKQSKNYRHSTIELDLNEKYSSEIEKIKKLMNAPDLTASAQDRLIERFLTIYQLHLRDASGYAIWLTPNKSGAEFFANENKNGKVIQSSMSVDDLKELSNQGKLYVGIENDYIEMALLSRKAIRLWVNGIK